MKNTTAMLDAIAKVFIKDLDTMTREELIEELTPYIEQSLAGMDSDQIHSTYRLMKEMGEFSTQHEAN
jgi:hypothetical protein